MRAAPKGPWLSLAEPHNRWLAPQVHFCKESVGVLLSCLHRSVRKPTLLLGIYSLGHFTAHNTELGGKGPMTKRIKLDSQEQRPLNRRDMQLYR